MSNMFKCVIAAGAGDGADLIVECSAQFAGSIITCTDGADNTFSETCPSSSPYEVTFKSIPIGTYTISGVFSGQTFSTVKTILNFTANLSVIPDGSTVTPINDIQTWLQCGNIWDKSYSTISQVLADTTTLLALINDNNAVDYLVRSTTWASSVCADSTAMTYIGLNDYCADTLLGDSTWLNAICNSTYFESVLNVKVPTMTSDTTPYGEVICGTVQSNYHAYSAFDMNTSTFWCSNAGSAKELWWVGYSFPRAICVKRFAIRDGALGSRIRTWKIQASNDKSTWTDLTDVMSFTGGETAISYYDLNNDTTYLHYRVLILTATNNPALSLLQFYGRSQS